MAAARIFDIKRDVLSTSGATTATLDIPIGTGKNVTFKAHINLKEKTGNTGGLIEVSGSINNPAGTAALGGTPIIPTPPLAAAVATATGVFTANGSNLRLTVTGVVLLDIDWQYEIKLITN